MGGTRINGNHGAGGLADGEGLQTMASIWAILRTLRGKGGILNKGVTWFHLSFKKMILVGCGD